MFLCIYEDKVKCCDRAFDGCSNCEDIPLAVTEHLSEAELMGLTDICYHHAAIIMKIRDALRSLSISSNRSNGNKAALPGILDQVEDLSDSMVKFAFALHGNLNFNYMTKTENTEKTE